MLKLQNYYKLLKVKKDYDEIKKKIKNGRIYDVIILPIKLIEKRNSWIQGFKILVDYELKFK